MIRSRLLLAAALFGLVACGGSSSVPPGPTAASVSVQPGDLPRGMVRCDLSGDINRFINQEQSFDPSTSNTASGQWTHLQTDGAKAADVEIYADSSAHCAAIKNRTSDIGAANYKLVVSFVIQFKDEKSAAYAYANDSILGASASNLRSGGAQATEGTKTGLTANSIVISQSFANQTFFIALWQNRTFDVYLVVLNFDPAASPKVAAAENSRVK